jgi:hypothetical protein
MSFNIAPHVLALTLAMRLYGRIMGRSELLGRPQFVIKAVAGRLRTGVRALRDFLRRVLVVMALEMEPDVPYVWHPENLARSKGKKPSRPWKPSLQIYPASFFASSDDIAQKLAAYQTRSAPLVTDADTHTAAVPRVLVPIGKLLDQLDYLNAIAKDPLAKVRRVAYYLARHRHGIILAPPSPPRLVWRCGAEISAIFDAMAYQIMAKSRTRPPPHPPPRRGPKPTITVLRFGPPSLLKWAN